MNGRGIDGWLLYDYRGLNPIFWETVGPVSNVTRPCWLWIPAEGEPRFLVAYVDQGRFGHLGVATTLYSGREEMVSCLGALIDGAARVAMEYSEAAELPRISRVDAGTVELVRGLGVHVVSSADTVQYAAQRWTPDQLASHQTAADSGGRRRRMPKGLQKAPRASRNVPSGLLRTPLNRLLLPVLVHPAGLAPRIGEGVRHSFGNVPDGIEDGIDGLPAGAGVPLPPWGASMEVQRQRRRASIRPC